MTRLLCWIFGHPGFHADTEVSAYCCTRCEKEWRVI